MRALYRLLVFGVLLVLGLSTLSIAKQAKQNARSSNRAQIQKRLSQSASSRQVESTPLETLHLNSQQLGIPGPFSLGLQYSDLTGPSLTGRYAISSNNEIGFVTLGELGSKQYRLNATLGGKVWDNSFAKVTIERLSQQLPFNFVTGTIEEKVGQNAFGFAMAHSMNRWVRTLHWGGYIAKADSITLEPVNFISNGSNCAGYGAGFECIDYRAIAGATSSGFHIGAETLLSPSTLLDSKLFFDNVQYHPIYSTTDENAMGLGAGLHIEQIISNHLKWFADAEVRRIYNNFTGGFSWLVPDNAYLNTEVIVSGQSQIQHNQTPNSQSLGVEFHFDLAPHSHAPRAYHLHPRQFDFNAWINEPAVYMTRVLAIADELVTLASPSILSINPATGPLSGHNVATITGHNFLPSVVVYIGSKLATVTYLSQTSLQVIVPAGLIAGAVDLTIVNPNQAPIVSTNAYTYYDDSPHITNVSPNYGPSTGGTNVTLTGVNFDGVTSLLFGGVAVSNLQVVNDTTITATTSAHAVGPVNIQITSPRGTSTLTNGFTYVGVPIITSIDPNAGSPNGGETITIHGSSFSGATTVTFGGVPAISFTVVNDTTITAVVPAHPLGDVDVVVTTPEGSTTLTGGYTYTLAPVIHDAAPTTGDPGGGTTVTLNGSNFATTQDVAFGGTSGTSLIIIDDHTLTVVAPPHAGGPVDITVTNPFGTATLSNGFRYAFTPSVLSLSPDAGPASGGSSVDIVGSNFNSAMRNEIKRAKRMNAGGPISVKFGGVDVLSLQVFSDFNLRVTTPPHAGGVVDVTVTTGIGSITLPQAYTYVVAPQINSVTPAQGPVEGNTLVTLSGVGFTEAMSLTFGGVAASSITVLNDTTLTARTPVHTVGLVDVRIVSPGGSYTSNNGYRYTLDPVLVNATPSFDFTAGGATVTLTGTHLTGTSAVSFGGVAATNITVLNDTTVTVTAPAHAAGIVDIDLTTPYGSANLPGGFTYFTAAPSLGSVSPNSGTSAGGTSVTISGSNFTGALSASLGGSPISSLSVVNDSTITGTTGAHAAGSVNVVVTTASGSGTLTNGYTYVTPAPSVNSVAPTSGTTAGSTFVTISGTAFTGATNATIGGVALTSMLVLNDATITGFTGAHAAGTVDVVVTTAAGSGTLTNGYTYVTPAPTVGNINPSAGVTAGGTSVTITGNYFTNASSVTVGGVALTGMSVVNDTTITGTTGAHAAGTVNIVVTTPSGSGTLTNGYTYIAPPDVTNISPTSGSISGGTLVSITGTGFTGATSATVGGNAITSMTVLNDTTITGVTAAHAAGSVNVVVTTPYGTDTLANGYNYVAPQLTSCGYSSAAAWLCTGTNLDLLDNTFIHIRGGLFCSLGVGVNSLLTTLQSATQLGGTTTPLLYGGCQISICDNSSCTGMETNIVTFS